MPQGPSDKIFNTALQSNRLSNTFKKFHGRHTDLVGQYQKNVSNVCRFYQLKCFKFWGFVMAELIKLAKMAGVMHKADRAYAIRSRLHRLATDVPYIACLSSIFFSFFPTTWICRIFSFRI